MGNPHPVELAGKLSFVAEVHAEILFEVCIIFDWITELVYFCVVLFCLSFIKEWQEENESRASQVFLKFLHRERQNYCFFSTDRFFV